MTIEPAAPPLRVEVRLFGAFRQYSERSSLSLEVPRGSLVSQVREAIVAALGATSVAVRQLVSASVLADDRQILAEAQELGRGADSVSLAILPPVCGG